jgi:hypothetical protein
LRQSSLIVPLVLLAGCVKAPSPSAINTTLTPETHTSFPIVSGPHAVSCNTCHGGFDSFQGFSCLDCHGHDVQAQTDELHLKIACGPGQNSGCYTYQSGACYSCHNQGARQAFDHFGVAGNCASCHDVNANFAALPVPGFTHIAITQDCGSCHNTSSWLGATGAPAGLKSDPTRNLILDAGIPSYVGSSIASIAEQTESLPMPMNHGTSSIDAGILSSCGTCHASAASGGNYYPGLFHGALAAAGLAQPTACLDCHSTSMPSGFVGPLATNPARDPPSSEMKHDAVVWVGGAPAATALVTADCGACHLSPSQTVASTWSRALDGGTPAKFHASLTSMAQPGSCIDCHANTRPATLLTNGACPTGSTCQPAPTLPINVEFDHTSDEALADCASCHVASGPGFASWASGQFHASGSANPTTCLPCHGAERPALDTGWMNPNYKSSPFDYGTNSLGITHGDGLDCVTCHVGPGTGTWGAGQNWATGSFTHGPSSASASTCISCHSSQRPDLVLGTAAAAAAIGFDHSINGNGDCYGCHQATVKAQTYVSYYNPATQTLPGGDWQGGLNYPGSTLIGSNTQFVTLTEITLERSATNNPNNLVTGTSSTTATLYNEMLHTSVQIPAQLQPAASDGGVIADSCWHCHTHTTAGLVTAYKDGEFHASLTGYTLTPDGGAVVGLPQPTTGCTDCHTQMRPTGIVELNGSPLVAMDHDVLFTGAVTLNGVSVTGTAQMDCGVCHHDPGVHWDGGVFHSNIGTAMPQDCTLCHYPLMADSALANLTSGTSYAMSHKSGQLTFQNCETCHVAALGNASTTPAAATLFKGGAFHASLTTQPAKCNDCHGVSEPKANASTQSSQSYTLSAGMTSTNQGQWMNHGAATVTGLDCVICHATDASASGSAWNKSDPFHNVTGVTTPTTCQGCHGLLNGGGAVAGTDNNLPSGLTNSSTTTTASNDSTTGVASGTYDQINHSDVNVTGNDCNFCHTQVGTSSVTGVAGKEWAQASFHANFTGANPLTLNTTTGRCSNCHMNVVPGSSFTKQDHSAFSDVSGSTDCNACHAFPGTGTTAAPNWLGAVGGAPTCFDAGGFTIPDPPAANNTTVQSGDACLTHPSLSGTESCTSCHTSASGGTGAIGYDHAATAQSCSECHEAGSNLVGTAWNKADGGSGDTRPISFTNNKCQCSPCAANNHFYAVDCAWCHTAPSGLTNTTNYASGNNAGNWQFHHPSKNGGCNANCQMCHGSCGCGN